MKKRRGRKPKSLTLTRDLSKNEILLIGYLWRWKVAPASLLKEAAFPKSSSWTFYKILKRLIKEKILMEIPRGKYFSHRLLALTEFGFEIYLRDLDYINRFRFRVHAPAHDYLATALQLGDFAFTSELGIEYFSEQELQTYLPEQLPYGFRRLHKDFQEGFGGSKSHVPDGLTVLSNNENPLSSVMRSRSTSSLRKDIMRFFPTGTHMMVREDISPPTSFSCSSALRGLLQK